MKNEYTLSYVFKIISDSELKIKEDIIKCMFLILMLCLYSTYERSEDVWKKLQKKPRWIRWSIYYILVYGILFVAPHSNVNNFIYFQF